MDEVIEQIKKTAAKFNNIEKVILFGSRARGDHTITSDYDIAVFGGNMSDLDKASFCYEVEDIDSLKKIDIVFVNEALEDDLVKNIKKDGVIIYEQV